MAYVEGRDRSETWAPESGRRMVQREAWTRPLGALDLVELAVDGGTLVPAFTPMTTRYRVAVRTRDAAGWGADDTGVRLRVRARPARSSTPVLLTSSTGEVVHHAHDVGWFCGAPGIVHHLTIALGDPDGPARTVSLSLE